MNEALSLTTSLSTGVLKAIKMVPVVKELTGWSGKEDLHCGDQVTMQAEKKCMAYWHVEEDPWV